MSDEPRAFTVCPKCDQVIWCDDSCGCPDELRDAIFNELLAAESARQAAAKALADEILAERQAIKESCERGLLMLGLTPRSFANRRTRHGL